MFLGLEYATVIWEMLGSSIVSFSVASTMSRLNILIQDHFMNRVADEICNKFWRPNRAETTVFLVGFDIFGQSWRLLSLASHLVAQIHK